jgi:hypothetical protein
MSDSFDKLKGRRSRLPDPPPDTSDNLRAPESAPAAAPAPISETAGLNDRQAGPETPASKPRIDGRARLRKDRTEALSTKIKPRHRELLVSLADAYELTLSETLERAIDTLAAEARHEGKSLA